uniref:SGNH hydrolase-type esterase domain-containing protein n=1 Tax=Oryzias latipes TaxID=8090 RepID=A0A3P9LB78_ORYLA
MGRGPHLNRGGARELVKNLLHALGHRGQGPEKAVRKDRASVPGTTAQRQQQLPPPTPVNDLDPAAPAPQPPPPKDSAPPALQQPPPSKDSPAPAPQQLPPEAVRFHCSKSRASPLLTDHRPQGEAAAAAVVMPVGAAPAPASPPPLFAPSTAIIGDSIIRKVRFFNAVTHCFPGATVPDILEKLPDLLRSLPSTVKRLILHVGFNDTSYRQSETTKKVFIRLFNFLNSCPLTVFISGPLPSLSRGQGRFSRLLSLSTWLQSVASLNKFVFIDNFNLFWNRTSFYKNDGIHPSPLGSNVLAANIRHSVQTSPAPIMPTPVRTSSSSVQTSVCRSD